VLDHTSLADVTSRVDSVKAVNNHKKK
jgi:hypothetical protein